MRSWFTVSLEAVELDTRLSPNKLPDEGMKVKISREHLQRCFRFSFGAALRHDWATPTHAIPA